MSGDQRLCRNHMPPQVLAFYQSRKDNNGKWWCHTRNAVLQEWEVLGHGVLCPAAPLRALRYSSAGGAHSKLGQDGRLWMSRCHGRGPNVPDLL
jgi:hypothetical protein